MAKFNPNQHSDRPLKVYIKRLDNTYEVVYMNILKHENYMSVWGFAKGDGEERLEFDTSWGDKIGVEL